MTPEKPEGAPSFPPGTPTMKNSALTSATNLSTKVARRSDRRSIPGQISLIDLGDTTAGTRRSRIAHASLFPPAARRTRYMITYRCPLCDGYHLGYADTRETASGRRAAGCGRIVVIRVARVYGDADQAARRRGSAA